MDNLANVQIESYLIESEIGRGGMAVVYKASHVRLGRVCAVKVLRPEYSTDERFIYRFLQEARSAAQLDHPNIVPIYDSGQSDDGQLFIAMKYLEGTSLLDMMAASRLSRRDAMLYLRQIASALDYAHSRNIVHRDVKPGNIIIDSRGWLTLTDFGIAKQIDTPGTQSTHIGSLIGTPAYMAPEQIQGEPTSPRTDVYQLGALAYEMLSGSQPFPDRVPTALLVAHLQETPEPIHLRADDLDSDVSPVVQKALEKQPANRYGSTVAFYEALERVVDPESDIDTVPVPNQRGPEISTDNVPPVAWTPGADPNRQSTGQVTGPTPASQSTTDSGNLPTVQYMPVVSPESLTTSQTGEVERTTAESAYPGGHQGSQVDTGRQVASGAFAAGASGTVPPFDAGFGPGDTASDGGGSDREHALPLAGAGLWLAGGAIVVLLVVAGAAAMFSRDVFGGAGDATETPTTEIATPADGTSTAPVTTTATAEAGTATTKDSPSATSTMTTQPTTSPTSTPTPTPTRTRTSTPTATATYTPTPVPPTDTPVPPTDTPVPPTSTPVPPTPVPPTNTPAPPPPTNTPVPPPPTPTPTPPSIPGP